ncbi:protein kinase [Diaporthe amygdali]|uniref:protein kinase n=1 Tax=Phomopsis amygdali TaxID=1214568 RepID=UPI0022FEBBB7|nr:protein kinase [Diaporthe amygdali]KAJ0120691.1 protein kinase [Diaporthe amygdali]
MGLELSAKMARHPSVAVVDTKCLDSGDQTDSGRLMNAQSNEECGVTITKSDTNDLRNHSGSDGSVIPFPFDEDEQNVIGQSPHDMPDRSTRSLQDELFSELIPTHHEKQGFFAKDQLPKILTEHRVRHELTTHFKNSFSEKTIASYAKKLSQDTTTHRDQSLCHDGQVNSRSFIKVLAILIIIQKTKDILKILEDGVSDSDLPLIKVPRPRDEKLFDLRLSREPATVLRGFQSWDQLSIRNFEEWQWTTLPLVFSRSKGHREVTHHLLQDQIILPFVKTNLGNEPHISHKTALEGGFASVFKVAIHPQHHNFHKSPDKSNASCFAIKGLHSQNRTAFKKEVEMLNKFSGNKHEHLISLLATYEQCDRFFLVFDWAEADLQGYWTRINPSPSFDRNSVLWLAKQCKGIASGITKIHEHVSTYLKSDPNPAGNHNVVFGHHGDIKPENVLYFAGPDQADASVGGTLKLSDFGLAEFSIHQTKSMTPRGKWGVSLGYRAPEVDLKQGAAIGRSYDIWTLGCLYLEFITWMLGGSQLLDEFLLARTARDVMWHDIETHTFFELEIEERTGEKRAIIKPVVEQFIKKLHSHQNCSEFIHEFLSMVEHDLLVVKKNDQQQIDRVSIQQVYQEFSRMLKRCESDQEYAIKSSSGSQG